MEPNIHEPFTSSESSYSPHLVVHSSQDFNAPQRDDTWVNDNGNNLIVYTQEQSCDDDDLSMDSSSNTASITECCNGPVVFTRQGFENCSVSPLSSDPDWVQNSPRHKSISSKSPRTKIQPSKKRFTPSKSCVPTALLGIVFEGFEEEIVFESISDAGSNHPYTPGKSLNDKDSLSDEPLFFHHIPVMPSRDVEQQRWQQQTPLQPGVFRFDHPKIVQSVSEENSFRGTMAKHNYNNQQRDCSTRHPKSLWRFRVRKNLFQRSSTDLRYKNMTEACHDQCDERCPEIMAETITTLSAEPDCNSPHDKLQVGGKVGRMLCLMSIVAMVLGVGVVGILLLTSEVKVLQTASNSSSEATPANTTISSRQDIYRTIIGSISGLDALDAHSTPEHMAWQWIANKDSAQIDPEKAKYGTIIERYIAALLFFATDGHNWKNQLQFLSQKPVCEWNEFAKVASSSDSMMQGIRCNDDGQIIRVDLPYNNLAGALPWELAGLESLQFFSAPRNIIKGQLPKQLGLLADLQAIDLTNNRISGSIPTEFGWTGHLRQIKLRLNNLLGSLPTTLGRLGNLKHLDVSNNLLTGKLPSELGKISTLKYVDVSHNRFGGAVPSELGARNYTIMDLSFNDFTGSLDNDFCLVKGESLVIRADCGGTNADVQCNCCLCCNEDTGCESSATGPQGKH
jgi:hypothetical protein